MIGPSPRTRRPRLTPILRPLAALPLLVTLALPPGAQGQSVADRTPNLSAGWTGNPGTVYFHFLHRFEHSDPPARKVVNYPTFLLGYTPIVSLLIGAQYTTNSDLVASYPNEWEPFARWATPRIGPARVALTGAYNNAAESVDGELEVMLDAGPVELIGAARAFSQGFGADERFALGGGAVLDLSSNVAAAADVLALTDRSAAEEVAWSAGLQLRIPGAPHSLSLQASNTSSATLQGGSRGGDEVRYGFEFTVPITLSRYFGGGSGGEAVDRTGADTVVVAIRDFSFSPARIRIQPGATVVWVNEGQVPHTATAAGAFDTGMIQPGARASHTFAQAGEHSYLCTPHPFMTGTVTVAGGAR